MTVIPLLVNIDMLLHVGTERSWCLLSTKRRNTRLLFGRTYLWTVDPRIVQEKVLPPSVMDASPASVPATSLLETQVTESENHPGWRKYRESGKFSGDIGGEFRSERRYVTPNKVPSVTMTVVIPSTTNPRRVTRVGPVLPMSSAHFLYPPSNAASSNAVLDAWGAKAIAQCKPTNSVVDMSTFLGEVIREGIPKMIGASLWKDKTREFRKRGADEFLNYQFGWAPIAREIGATAHAIVNADVALRQYRRDSGKMVRRRFEFPPEVTTSSVVLDDTASPFLGGKSHSALTDGSNLGRLIRTHTVSRRRWFSGAFTYYIPTGDSLLENMQEKSMIARKTIGLSLTPDVVWNLAPWSWAVDWFTNAGDVISNFSSWSADGLVMKYGYMMETTTSTYTYSFAGPTGFVSSSYRPPSVSFTHEVKVRRKANPFGFGLTWNGLSPIQLAIATALSINRS